MQSASAYDVSITDKLSKVWEHLINVVPTRMMVFGPNDATKTQPRSDGVDRKENECKGEEEDESPQASSGFGNWHSFPIYVFFMFSWTQDGLVSLGTTYLPIGDFGRNLLHIGVALLLSPVQLAATLASSNTACSQKTRESKATEKKPADKSKEDSPFLKPTSTSATAVLVLRITAAMYSWLAPITLLWACSFELTKGGTLKLSRYLSLTQYAADSKPLRELSTIDLVIVSSKVVGLLMLYVVMWMTLTLPATIVLRRVHASEWKQTLLRAIRRETRAPKQNLLSYSTAWRSFAWGPYRRLLAVYACVFIVLLLVAVGGMQFFLMALAFSTNAKYTGFWASLYLYLKMAVGKFS